MTVDLNADAGESYGAFAYGHDREIFPLVTSVNLACGFHGGSPNRILEAVRLAKAHGVAVGAHPGFPDLVGFGRRDMALSPEEVFADVLYQIGALSAFLKAEGLPLHHVKPHGALYLKACRDRETAEAIALAVKAFDPGLPLVVLPGTVYEEEARRAGLRVVLEAFPERAYLRNGQLAPRSMPGSWITDPRRPPGGPCAWSWKEGGGPGRGGGGGESRHPLHPRGQPQGPRGGQGGAAGLGGSGGKVQAF